MSDAMVRGVTNGVCGMLEMRALARPPSPIPVTFGVSEDRKGALAPDQDGSTLSGPRLQQVPLARIEDNPHQPRQKMDVAELEPLANSIRQLGVIEPLVGRPHPTKPGFVQLAAGARRRAAAAMAGLAEVPVVVRELDDKAMRLFALAENIHRLDLADVDREEAYSQLWEEVYKPLSARAPGDKHLDLMAQELGLSRVTVGDVLRAHEARKTLGEGAPDLSTQDAAVLAPLARADPASARALVRARVEGRLTADQLAKLAPRIRSLPPERRAGSLGRFLGRRPSERTATRETSRPPGPPQPPREPLLRQLSQILQSVRAFTASAHAEAFRDDEERQHAIDMMLEIQRILGTQLDVLMQDVSSEHPGER